MGRNRKVKLRAWLNKQLYEKWQKGVSHPKEKGIHNETPYIHSNVTYKGYKSRCNIFVDWCKEQGITDVDEAFKSVKKYGESLEKEGKSAWTIYTSICAIAKAYGVSTTEFGYKPPKRERADIKRSRYTAKRDKHFSEANNEDLLDFAKSTGLRRHELKALHGTQLAVNADGTYCLVNIKGKGGKVRNPIIIGSPKEIETVIRLMKKAGDGLVFQHIHSAFDEHYYRGIYACRAYKKMARPIEELDGHDRYICRKDKAGTIYDRQAMFFASEQLGHERECVIANSYLYNL